MEKKKDWASITLFCPSCSLFADLLICCRRVVAGVADVSSHASFTAFVGVGSLGMDIYGLFAFIPTTTSNGMTRGQVTGRGTTTAVPAGRY